MPVGNMENAQANSPESTSFSKFGRAADATDEGDALAGARVLDVEKRGEDFVLEQRDIEQIDGGSGGGEFRLEDEAIPLAAQIETELVFGGRAPARHLR